ncbi:hypothetical protein Q664_29805 [Archangium violaceum Cb vi76]|uniref:Uncharacterized protein n=1 Tax=Archangium violaceum Cb vi76 TaxID=1406225 RepID=A0A084SNY7_9BACT|nr:hypothetical protein Q664_29805 [Archangium violaceum Cb vi76]
MRAWQHTATWMAPHAKYVAVFDEPFWRRLGLSGEARSRVGPLAEVHDASDCGGEAALFGMRARADGTLGEAPALSLYTVPIPPLRPRM